MCLAGLSEEDKSIAKTLKPLPPETAERLANAWEAYFSADIERSAAEWFAPLPTAVSIATEARKRRDSALEIINQTPHAHLYDDDGVCRVPERGYKQIRGSGFLRKRGEMLLPISIRCAGDVEPPTREVMDEMLAARSRGDTSQIEHFGKVQWTLAKTPEAFRR